MLGGPDFVDSDFTTSLGPSAGGGIWATDWDGGEQPGGQTDLRRYAANAGAGATPTYVPATYRATWFSTPLVLDPSGAVWCTDNGDYLREAEDSGATRSFPISGIPLGAPNALAFDGRHDLWFTSEYPGTEFTSADDGAIGHLPAGGASATATRLPAHDVPTSIARGPDGNMYFGWYVGPSTTGPHGGIGQINTRTGKITLASLGGLQPASVTFAPDGSLWFVDAGLNQVEHVDVSKLFGGAEAAKPALAVPHQTLAAVRAHRRLTVACALAGAGRCAIRATVSGTVAKRLGLDRHRVLGSTSRRLAHRGRVTLRLNLSAKVVRALRRVRSLKLTLVATSSAAGRRARTARRSLTLQ